MPILELLKIALPPSAIATIIGYILKWKLKDSSYKKANRKELLAICKSDLDKTKSLMGIASSDSLSIFLILGQKLIPHLKKYKIKEWENLKKEIYHFVEKSRAMFENPNLQLVECKSNSGETIFEIAEFVKRRPEVFQNLSSLCHTFFLDVISELYRKWKIH